MTGLLSPVVQKEIRALLPAWAGCMVAVTAAAVSRDERILLVAVFAYGLGALALGAQAIGHEYSHRTLAALLAQPIDRRRVYAVKMGVLSVMLIALAVAWQMQPGRVSARHLGVLPALCGLGLAPWLTMISRNPIASIVFSAVIPLSLLLAGDVIGAAMLGGADAYGIDRFKFAVMWWGTLAACAAAAVAGWRTFMRLESIDGPGAPVTVPPWFQAAAPRPAAGHPLWALAKKELHLQQMTFVVVLIYVCAWAVLSIVSRRSVDIEMAVIPLTAIYLALLALLIGSLASAEERQYGTLEWQMLAPIAAWQQWAVKASVAIGLALALGLALPILLSFVHAVGGDLRTGPVERSSVVVVILLTVSSLYVSSLCSSGVKAMVLVLPIGLVASQLVTFIAPAVDWIVFNVDALGFLVNLLRPLIDLSFLGYTRLFNTTALGLAAVYAALMLRLAFMNHRSTERSLPRIGRQACCIAGFATFASLVLAFVSRLYRT